MFSIWVEAQSADPASMLALYRRALRVRRAEFGSSTAMTWLPAPGGPLPPDTAAWLRAVRR